MTQHSQATSATSWVAMVSQAAIAYGHTHIDLIIDQTGWHKPFIPVLTAFQPPLTWISLFADTPFAGLQDDSPLLLRLSLNDTAQRQWFDDLAEHFAQTARLLALISPAPFPQLAQHLSHHLYVSWPDDEGILRYYDTRLLESLQDVLTPGQREQFHAQTQLWSWPDRDGKPAWLPGSWNPARELPLPLPTITLNADQVDHFSAATEAEALLHTIQDAHPRQNREQLFRQLRNGFCYANTLGLLDQGDRNGLALGFAQHGAQFVQLSPWRERINQWQAGQRAHGTLRQDLAPSSRPSSPMPGTTMP